jgi:DUF4097 and DUF4098 domain-containing protein YvlB
MSFSTFNGPIDVTFPVDVKVNVKLKTYRGEIYSDFEMKLGVGIVMERNVTPDGKLRLRADRTLYGAINGGGTEASFQTFNGRIVIRKK